jgi:thiamine biosynthesis protein ThiI
LPGVVLISTAEFALKSQPVRRQLIRLLKRHVRFNLKRVGLETCEIRLAGGFLVVGNFDNAESVANGLARIFGVAHADACERAASSLDEIVECATRLAEQKLKPGETFAVRARNYEPSQLKSKEIEVRAGAEVLSRLPGGVRVNLSNPDHTLRVFFGANDAFVSAARFDGPGGLPVGSQGKLLGLATDPVHSPLSFCLLMKRGAMVSPVIPNIPSLLRETQLDAILDGLRTLKPFVPRKGFSARLIELDEDASEALDEVDRPLQRIFSIRLTLRAITHLIQSQGALGLVSGDRFGRDGLETLKDLRIVDDISKFPIYRPLLTMDEDSVNQELGALGLRQLITKEASRQVTEVGFSDASIANLKEVEGHVQAERLAQRIAANSTRILI